MKKILLAIVFIFVCGISAFAEDWNSTAALNRVNTIGTNIIKSNGIGQQITFKVSEQADVNAYANINKEVYVYKGLLDYVTNDEELAAVISHELGHILNGHCAKQGVLNTGVNILANATARVAGSTVAG